jgi:hypothetical protein
MQLAETLGITAEDVKPQVVDTDSVGYNDVTGGSRVTFASGWAVYEAGMSVREQIMERAAKIWEVPVSEVAYDDGVVLCMADQSKRMTFKEFAAQMLKTGPVIVGTGSVAPVGVGGAYGKGILYERGVAVGYCDLSQATVGAQLGGQAYTEIICFETQRDVNKFKEGKLQFDAQATAVAVKSGAGANLNYRDGVAVFTRDEAGLMAEAAIGGQKFTYQPK